MPNRQYATVATVAVLIAALAAGSCSTRPMRAGPQITRLPAGFIYDGNASGPRQVLSDRTLIRTRGYFTIEELTSSIVITEYRGLAGEPDALSARDAQAASFRYSEVGPLEPLRLDGHRAWGWLESALRGDTLVPRVYTAIVSYGNETYSVEFYAMDPRHQNATLMREVVSSFVVARDS